MEEPATPTKGGGINLAHTAPVRRMKKVDDVWEDARARVESADESIQWKAKAAAPRGAFTKPSELDVLIHDSKRAAAGGVGDGGPPSKTARLPDLALGTTAPSRAHKSKEDMKQFGQRRHKALKNLNAYVAKVSDRMTALIERRRAKNLELASEALFYASKVQSGLPDSHRAALEHGIPSAAPAVAYGGERAEDDVDAFSRTIDAGRPRGADDVASTTARVGDFADQPAKGTSPRKKTIASLKWVKQLVQYTESYPVLGAETLPRSVRLKIEEAGGNQKQQLIEQTVFPSLKPDKREDAFLLECWLIDIMKSLAVDLDEWATVGGGPAGTHREDGAAHGGTGGKGAGAADGERTIEDVADATLWVYRTAFEEILRQVKCLCKVKADLLNRIWDHFFWMLELRAGLKYEEEVQTLAKACDSFRMIIKGMEHDGQEVEKSYQHKLDVALQERLKIERDASRIAERFAIIGESKNELERQLDEANKHHLSEIHTRLGIEERLSEVSKLLRNEKSLHADTNREKQNLLKLVKDLKEELKEKNTELNGLYTENDSLKSQVQSLEMLVARYEGQLEQVKTDMLMERNLKAASQEDLKHLRKLMKKKEATEAELNRNNADLKSRNEQLESRVAELEGKLGDKSRDFDDLTAEHKALNAKYDETSTALSDLTETRANEQQQHEATLNDMNAKASDAGAQIESLKKDIANRNIEISDLSKQVRKHDTAHKSIRAVLEPIADDFDEDRLEYDPFKKEREEPFWLEVGMGGKVYQTLIKATTKLSKADEELRNAGQRVAVYQQRFEMEEELRKKHEEKIFEEKSRNERLTRELAMERKAHSSSNISYEEAAATNSRLERENDEKRHEIKTLKDKVRDLTVKTSSFTQVQEENVKLKEGLRLKKKTVDELTAEGKAQKKEIKRLDKLQKETSNEVTQRIEMVKRLTKHTDFLSKEVKARDGKIEVLLEQCSDLHEKLANEEENKKKDTSALVEELALAKKRLTFHRDITSKLQAEVLRLSIATAVSKFMLHGLKMDPNKYETDAIMKRGSKMILDANENDAYIQGLEEANPEDGQDMLVVPPQFLGKEKHAVTWMRVKVALMGLSNRSLRKQLQAEAKAHRDCLECFTSSITDLKAMYESLLDTMATMNKDLLVNQIASTKEFNAEMESIKSKIVSPLCKWGISCGTRLNGWERRFNTRVDCAIQANDAMLEPWLQYIADLPNEVPTASAFLEKRKVAKTICQIYCKRLDSSLGQSVVLGYYGDMRTDTVFDAIMITFRQMYGQFDGTKSEKHITEFLCMLRPHEEDLKISTFSRFCGIKRPLLGAQAYYFMLDILDCIRRLMGVNWRTILQQWENGNAGLPVPCMMDALCNVYNTNNPANLAVVQSNLRYAITDGKLGPCVDLDTFIDTMINEFEARSCPISPALAPRRLVDTSSVNRLEL